MVNRAPAWRGFTAILVFGVVVVTSSGAREDNLVEPGRIETVAGGGRVGDDGPAQDARLSLPGGVVIAPKDDLIIVDFGNHRIRRVDRKSGTITTIVGTGAPGFSGDGGPGNKAQLARPESAAFGPDGSLYIVDSHNHRIRRLDRSSGVIQTVVGTGEPGFAGDGGNARHARLFQPEGIAFDREGNYFIGDTLNGRIRRVDARTGVISSVAGSGEVGVSPDGTAGPQMRFLRLARLAVDRAGNLLIADSPSQRIQVLDFRTGQVRTLAGTGEEGFAGDGGPAASARLAYPEGLAVDSAGDVYFADLGNHRVRRIDSRTGVITTVAGCGRKGFSGDGGPAVAAELWSPGRLACDSSGKLYIADILNARVRVVDRATGLIYTAAGSGDLGDHRAGTQALLCVPGDLAYQDRRLYISEFGNRRVRCLELDSGIIRTVVGGGTRNVGRGCPATDAELRMPEGIAVDGRGGLYVSDSLAHRVWHVDLRRNWIRPFAGCGLAGYEGDGGPAVDARLLVPGGLAVGPDRSVYVADYGNNCIRAVDVRTGIITTLVGEHGSDPEQASVRAASLSASDNHLAWVCPADRHVYIWDRTRGNIARYTVLPAKDNVPASLSDLAVRGSSVFVVETLAHRILRLDLHSRETTQVAGCGQPGFAGDQGPAAKASLFRPGAIAVGEPGELFVADTFNHRVRRITLGPERRDSAR